MSYIYSCYTNRNFKVRSTSIADMVIVACMIVWFIKFEEYMFAAANDGFKLEENPTRYHMFMQRMLNDINTGDFHFDWLLAATAFLFWIRLIFMLQLTQTFGPLIRTTVAMMSDLITFFLLFSIQLIAFSCVGILAFGNLPGFETVFDGLVLLFGSALGEYNFDLFNELGEDKKYIGIGFLVIFLACNLLLLLNLVIAIMADTY